MARIKISKVAKDLNVALPTVVEFLRGKNITVDDNPNARIEEEVVSLLVNAFKSDKDQKSKSQQLSTDRARDREKSKPAPREVEEISLKAELNKPRILGTIELDKHGNPVRKPAPVKEAPAPEAMEEKPTPAPAQAPAETPKQTEEKPEPVNPEAAPEPEKPQPAVAKQPEEPKAEPAKTAPANADKPQQPKAQHQAPANEHKPKQEQNQKSAQPAPAATTPAKAEKPAAPAEKADKEEIFTVGRPQNMPTINVVGKIDLSAINLSLIHI